MDHARIPAARRTAAVLATLLAASTALAVRAPAARAEVLAVSPTGTFVVEMRGNGHAHGMSQYGARGAATKGLTARQIVAFYYPGTKVVAETGLRRIRVRISGAGPALTVAAAGNLTVTGIADALPADGISRYRLVQGSGSGLWLQRLDATPGAVWTTVRMGLPNRAEFHRTGWGPVRVYFADGTSIAYFGYVRAVRNTPSGSPGGLTVVNRVGIDNYTAGVVAREIYTSWPGAAVQAQAIAARTYGAYAMAHPQSRDYDLCDTTQCQVYGGHAHFTGAVRDWTDYQPAATATAGLVLEYAGAPIFAQFSASNGGWSVAGGQPYLPAKQDLYDPLDGNPYIDYRRTFAVSRLAKAFGLATVTEIAVTRRDGNGLWNGRMLAGYVSGTDALGAAKRVDITGFDLAGALGLGTTWLRLLKA
jgi:peptidoglycan hydrolase-like amidase